MPLLLAPTKGSNQGLLGTPPSNHVFLYYVYVIQQTFGPNRRFGYGFALIWILMAIIVGVTIIVWQSQRFWVFNPGEE